MNRGENIQAPEGKIPQISPVRARRVRPPLPKFVNLLLLAATFLTVNFVGWSLTSEIEVYEADIPTFLQILGEYTRPGNFLSGFPYTLSILAILGAHEMGHYLACRRYGIPATLPFFIPGLPPFGTFGAVIRIRGMIPNRRALFDISAAGPIAGFLVALPLMVIGAFQAVPIHDPAPPGSIGLGESLVSIVIWNVGRYDSTWAVGPIYYAAWFGMLVTSMNLFPVGQLDGGHIVYAVSRRLHRLVSRATVVLLGLLVLVSGVVMLSPPVYLIWFVVLLLMRDRHPRLVHENLPLSGARKAVGLLLLLLFVLTFMPVPILFP